MIGRRTNQHRGEDGCWKEEKEKERLEKQNNMAITIGD